MCLFSGGLEHLRGPNVAAALPFWNTSCSLSFRLGTVLNVRAPFEWLKTDAIMPFQIMFQTDYADVDDVTAYVQRRVSPAPEIKNFPRLGRVGTGVRKLRLDILSMPGFITVVMTSGVKVHLSALDQV